MGTWIETPPILAPSKLYSVVPAWGRGLKRLVGRGAGKNGYVVPAWGRGLKLQDQDHVIDSALSSPLGDVD